MRSSENIGDSSQLAITYAILLVCERVFKVKNQVICLPNVFLNIMMKLFRSLVWHTFETAGRCNGVRTKWP